MDITFLGHSSFRIRSKDVSLVTDPYDSDMVGLKYPKISADIVTISHDHNDHNKSELISDTQMVITAPGEYEVKDTSIIGIPTYHDDNKGTDRGRNVMYLIELEDVRILHTGDLGHSPDKKIIESVGDLDVLMVPVGGVYTIGAKVATELANELEPSYVIPMHYKMTGMKEETFGKLAPVDDFLKDCGYDVENLDRLSLKKELIDMEKVKVVVLSKK